MSKRVWIRPFGNMGNRALQYLVGTVIQQHAPGAALENIQLPEWGLVAAHPEPPLRNSAVAGLSSHWIDAPGLGDCLRRGVVETVFLEGYPYNIANLPPRALARRLIGQAVGGEAARGFGRHQLVCSVRGAEIITAIHPDYILLPSTYYKMLAERSGLELVFYGQIGDDPYSHALRQAFPSALFVPSQSPGHDFEMLRRSVNIAPSVSTFAWLAAWLSEAERIYLPVGGIFSPVQLPHIDFLPLGDPVFEYTLLPYTKAVNLHESPAKFAHQQAVVSQWARPVGVDELREICRRAVAMAPPQPVVGGFDPEFYLTLYADIAIGLEHGLRSALQHYIDAGFREGRMPLAFDDVFYANCYPDAAMEIAQGHYSSPLQHYLLSGRPKGYHPLP